MSIDLADVLGTEETSVLEFKEGGRDSDVVGRAVCAFANDLPGKGGGDLLIGVRDNGTPRGGVDTSDAELVRLSNVRDDGQVLDMPSMTVERALFRGAPVIRIHVEAATAPPVRYKGVVWVRPGPTTRRATKDDERVLSEKRRMLDMPFDTRPVRTATLDDLDLQLFASTYLPEVVDADVIAENGRSPQQQLAALQLADTDVHPTVLGLLVLGFDPRRHLPGAYLRFARFAGTDIADSPIVDDQVITANLVNLNFRLDAVLRGHIHTALVATGGLREERRPTYPWPALRETCMNAVMHRNYETSRAPVQLYWFDDRIEISNPGGPFGRVRVDNFDRVNDYRNPSLAAAMHALGYVNQFGRGIRRIRTSMAENGNPEPEFTVDDGSWSVVLRGAR